MEQKPYNPYIISHRGYSSLFTENTIESIEAALHKAHLIEFDIQLTKDEQIVVFHDRYLSQLTNVASLAEFEQKKAEFVNDFKKGEVTNDWWVKDFTLDELRKLKVIPKSAKRPKFRHQTHKISTLNQVIEEILFIKGEYLKQNTCGFLIQIKCEQQYKFNEKDKVFAERIVQCLQLYGLTTEEKCKEHRLPIIVQSFNHQILQIIAKSTLNLPLYYLLDSGFVANQQFFKQLPPKAKGISVSIDHLKPEIKKLCVQHNLLMFFWTLIDDQPELLQPSKIPSFKDAYFMLFGLKIDGIITDFPQKCEEYFNLFKALRK